MNIHDVKSGVIFTALLRNRSIYTDVTSAGGPRVEKTRTKSRSGEASSFRSTKGTDIPTRCKSTGAIEMSIGWQYQWQIEHVCGS
jgi:hypothetical protein